MKKFLGYIFSDKPENTLRYIAAVLMVFGAKLVFERFAEGDAVPVLISAAATAFASFGYAAMTVISGYGSLMALAETVICAGAAYFFKRTEEAFEHGKNLSLLSSGDRACVIMTAAIAATSLIGVTFGKLSLGGIAACFAVLFSARYGRENGGSVSGVAVGTATSLAEGVFGFGFAGYALGGLVSGIFSVFGKSSCFFAKNMLYVKSKNGRYKQMKAEFKITSKSPQFGSVVENISNYQFDSQAFEINVDCDYVTQAIRAIGKENISFKFSFE